jgi:hypothetical protein
VDTINYPSLSCPFPSAISPHAAEAQHATVAWARRLHLVPQDGGRLHRLQNGILMARAYPSAEPEMLQIAADWGTWLFTLDDQCDEAGLGQDPEQLVQLHVRLLDILQGAPPCAEDLPHVHGLWDLHRRISIHAPEGWDERFRKSVSQYFTANVWEANNRRRRQIPDIASYCTMRRFTSAVYPCLLLIEVTEGLRLPPDVSNHPDVQSLSRMANNVISWSNDIVSLEKERRQGDIHNLAIVLSNEQSLSLQTAVDRVAVLYEDEIYAFIALARRLPSFTPSVDRDLQCYVAGLRSWMRANLDWSQDTYRYHGAAAQPVLA